MSEENKILLENLVMIQKEIDRIIEEKNTILNDGKKPKKNFFKKFLKSVDNKQK